MIPLGIISEKPKNQCIGMKINSDNTISSVTVVISVQDKHNIYVPLRVYTYHTPTLCIAIYTELACCARSGT